MDRSEGSHRVGDDAAHPVRIAHLITGLNVGGAERALAKLVAGMDREQYDNTVVSMVTPGEVAEEIVSAGVPVLSLGMRSGMPDPTAMLKLGGILYRVRPHILQTWMYHANLLGLVATAPTSALRLVWNIRNSDLIDREPVFTRLAFRLCGTASRVPSAVVINSESGLRFHQRHGYQPRRWELIPNGFDLATFAPNPEARVRFRAELGVPADAALIGIVARYHPVKDHATFLRAAARLDLPNTHFVLVGYGLTAGNDALRGLLGDPRLAGHTHLLGARRDVPHIMAALDLLTLSSTSEGWPNVVGEAMACGVPCVVTSVGDAGLIVGDTGIVVPPSDPQALAAAWQRLLCDDVLRLSLGARARTRVDTQYSLQAVIHRYEALYQSLVPV